jgi:hypothetical protein
MSDSPDAAVGHEGVAVAADVVEADMGHDSEVTRHLRLVSSQLAEEHIGDVVPDDRLDVSADGDVAGDAAEECQDLGSAAQRFKAADLQNAVRAEGVGEIVEPPGVTLPVVSSERVPDVLAGDQLPDLHRRPPQDGWIVCW